MDFLGIGPMEIAVVFLVAFIALGPGKSIEMARAAGKFLRDLRRTFDEVTSAINLEEDDQRPSQPTSARPPVPPTEARPFDSPSDSSALKDDPSPPPP